MAKINMQTSFNILKQGPFRDISEFKKEFNTLVRCMWGANIPEMVGKTFGIWLLEKQNTFRHCAKTLYITNGITAGQSIPATADEAYIIAKNWKSFSTRVTDSRRIIAKGLAFMLADEVCAFAIVPSLASSE